MSKTVLPPNHPKVKKQKIGVLILNLGTPDATDYWSMRRYLSEFLSDQRVIDFPKWLWQPLLQGIILTKRPFSSGHAYEQIWNKKRNESPLLTYTRSQSDKIGKILKKKYKDVVIDFGMRYGNPSTAKGIQSLLDQGCTKILLFALYPQYAAPTTATAYDKAFDYLKTLNWQPAVRTAPSWYDHSDYIKVLGNSVKDKLKGMKNKPDVIVTSFHGVPKRYLMAGDPYHCFCQKTSRLVQEYLKWPKEKWITTFQSRFGPEEWVQPYTDETIENLAKDGIKHVAILSPAFVSDCVETLEEINIGVRKSFLENGGKKFTYIPCLNDTEPHIKLLSKLVENELKGWI